MKSCVWVLAAMAALVLAAPTAARRDAAKTPLELKLKERTAQERSGSGTFTLVGASARDTDSGSVAFTESAGEYGQTADGLQFITFRRTETLTGKRGKLVLRSTVRVFQVGVIEEDDMIATGTWSVVRSSGKYAGLTGGGGAVGFLSAVSPHSEAHVYSYRYKGFVRKG